MSGVELAIAVVAVAALVVAVRAHVEQRRLSVRHKRPGILTATPAEPAPPVVVPGKTGLDRLGLVRFRAYDDTGGDYSFALALLDSSGGGAVVTCLYHRERCRLYAKPVSGWRSDLSLTSEEQEAIARAGERDDGRAGAARVPASDLAGG